MKKCFLFVFFLSAFLFLMLGSCTQDKVTGNSGPYLLFYDGNGNDIGIPPSDENTYQQGEQANVLTPENMINYGFSFINWNTKAYGNGTSYEPGNSITFEDSDITLYAQWRWNTIGQIDNGFGNMGVVMYEPDNGYRSIGKDVFADESGNVYVCGEKEGPDYVSAAIWKYKPNGTLDTDFGSNGAASFGITNPPYLTAEALDFDTDGNIYIVGHGSSPGGYTLWVWKFSENGVLDTSFGNEGYVKESGSGSVMANFAKGFDICVDSDNTIYICGYRQNDVSRGVVVFSYDNTGSRNSDFGVNGMKMCQLENGGLNTEEGYAMTSDGNGNLYIAGFCSSSESNDFIVLKITSGGVFDPNFGSDGWAVISDIQSTGDNEKAYAIDLDSEGNILVAGTCGIEADENMVLFRLTPEGVLDTTFNENGYRVIDSLAGGSGNDGLLSIDIVQNGCIYAAGYSVGAQNMDIAVLRLGPSGLTDYSFGNNGKIIYNNIYNGGYNDAANAIVMDNFGHLYITGYSNNSSGNKDMFLLRYY